MRKVNCAALAAVDTSSQNGAQLDTNQWVSASFHAVFGDSTAAGTVKLQASNDIFLDQYQPGNFTVTNWVDLPNQSATITSGAPAILTVAQCAYRWMRVVYTSTSGGSSTVTVNVFALSV